MGKKQANKNKKVVKEKKRNPLFEKRPRNFRIGNDIMHKKDLTRYVRWPKYILLQRQKRVLLRRLKVPPSIAQFQYTLDSNQSSTVLKTLKKYSPETRTEKKARLLNEAKNKVDNKKSTDKAPICIKYGLNHITKSFHFLNFY